MSHDPLSFKYVCVLGQQTEIICSCVRENIYFNQLVIQCIPHWETEKAWTILKNIDEETVGMFGWLLDNDTVRRDWCSVVQQWNRKHRGEWKNKWCRQWANTTSARQLIKDKVRDMDDQVWKFSLWSQHKNWLDMLRKQTASTSAFNLPPGL